MNPHIPRARVELAPVGLEGRCSFRRAARAKCGAPPGTRTLLSGVRVRSITIHARGAWRRRGGSNAYRSYLNRFRDGGRRHLSAGSSIVGLAGFEPASSRPRTERSTKLSHNPLVGTAGFEFATARPPAACSTKLSHVPMRTPSRIRTCDLDVRSVARCPTAPWGHGPVGRSRTCCLLVISEAPLPLRPRRELRKVRESNPRRCDRRRVSNPRALPTANPPWRQRGESNPRPSARQADALPLSYVGMVDPVGLEPTTSAVQERRSTR